MWLRTVGLHGSCCKCSDLLPLHSKQEVTHLWVTLQSMAYLLRFRVLSISTSWHVESNFSLLAPRLVFCSRHQFGAQCPEVHTWTSPIENPGPRDLQPKREMKGVLSSLSSTSNSLEFWQRHLLFQGDWQWEFCLLSVVAPPPLGSRSQLCISWTEKLKIQTGTANLFYPGVGCCVGWLAFSWFL